MGNKNYRGSAAQVRPSSKFLAETPKARPFIELSALTQHPAITIIDNKHISIYIEMCPSVAEHPITDMPALLAALPEYKYIKKLSVKIHAPWPKTECRKFYNNRVSLIKKLFAIINAFKLCRLKVIMSIDGLNFPQMKLGAAVHELKFKKWQLFYQVYDEAKELEGDAIKIYQDGKYLE
ncbi:hypothetical protein SBOR_9823 [Sclerotinia borealis F-4128]|uniref:Uncharacterized protein n=1 Tax=Sclerotinia borealis (strain F-4128) TaxID=1432307 RepID=W9C4I4_SCLBF|nr:hypothetical protein SBOR_9823 [Sclerotinia borealis F-4128]